MTVQQLQDSGAAEAYRLVLAELKRRSGRDLGLMFGEPTELNISAQEDDTLNARYIGRDMNNHYFAILNHIGNAYAIVRSRLDYTTKTKEGILCPFAHYREIDNEEQKTLNTILNGQTLEELMGVLQK